MRGGGGVEAEAQQESGSSAACIVGALQAERATALQRNGMERKKQKPKVECVVCVFWNSVPFWNSVTFWNE